jgi:hypothetical protein
MSLLGFGEDSATTVQIDEGVCSDLDQRAEQQTNVVEVMPYQDDLDLTTAMRFLEDLHDVEKSGVGGRKNVSDPLSIELVFEDGSLRFRFGPGNRHQNKQVQMAARTHYGDADINEAPSTFLDVEPGQHLAGAWLTLRDPDYFLPIKHYQISPNQFETDPYDSITSELVGLPTDTKTNAMVQIVLRPAWSNHPRDRKNWYHGVDKTAERLKQPSQGFRWGAVAEGVVGAVIGGEPVGEEGATKTTPATSEQKQAAETVANQRAEKGYHLNVRVFAASEDPEEAIERVEDTARMYRTFYTSTYEQGFKPKFPGADGLRGLSTTAASRKWIDRNIVFSTSTLAGLAHLPTDLNTQQIDYSRTSESGSTPSAATEFESFQEESDSEAGR